MRAPAHVRALPSLLRVLVGAFAVGAAAPVVGQPAEVSPGATLPALPPDSADAPTLPDSVDVSDEPRSVRPLLLVTSGGVSKGAYQAGVSWAVLRLLKDAGSPGIDLQPHELVVSTGASAGSANTLLSVAEWARPRTSPRTPQSSPYWTFWTSLGLGEVIPPCRTCDPDHLDIESALSRRTIEEVLIPETMTAMADPDLSLDRPIYTGFMLTTRDPFDVVVSDGLTVPSLRASMSASATPVRGEDGRSLGIAFESANLRLPQDDGVPSHRVRPYPEMGPVAHAALTPLAQTTNGEAARACDPGAVPVPDVATRAEQNRDAFARGALASAAFPYAWAPVSLSLSAGLDARGFPLEERAAPREYLDGGVFDNNPLSLAIHLSDRASLNAEPCTPDAVPLDWSRPTILFIDPDASRPPRPAAGPSVGAPGDRNRFADLLGFANQFMESGRAYEIESESRHLAPAYVEGLRATSRAFPIVGSELYSFGTFLARPFRLYDFYVGVYDGYVYAVQKLTDTPPAGPEATGAAVLALYDASGLAEADPLADVVFRDLLRAEFPSTTGRLAARPLPESHPEVDARWARVLRVHVETALAYRDAATWFGPLTAALTADPEVVEILAGWSRECEQALAAAAESAGASRVSRRFVRGRDCDAIPQLLPILREPTRRLLGIGSEILTHRVSAEGSGGSVGFSLALAAVNVYLTTNRPGLHLNRSIVPTFADGLYGVGDYGRAARLRRWLIRGIPPARMVVSNGPYFATSALSWKVGAVHLVAEAAPLRQERVVRDGNLTVLSYSGHLGVDVPVVHGAAGLGLRASVVRPYADRGSGVGVEAFARIGHVFSLGVVATPWGSTWQDDGGLPTRFNRQAFVSASLHDIGGLLYWLSRVVAG